MASLSCSISSTFTPKLVCHNKFHPTYFPYPNFRANSRFYSIKTNQAINSSKAATTSGQELDIPDEDLIGIDNLKSFVQLNLGKWNGSFHVGISFFHSLFVSLNFLFRLLLFCFTCCVSWWLFAPHYMYIISLLQNYICKILMEFRGN